MDFNSFDDYFQSNFSDLVEKIQRQLEKYQETGILDLPIPNSFETSFGYCFNKVYLAAIREIETNRIVATISDKFIDNFHNDDRFEMILINFTDFIGHKYDMSAALYNAIRQRYNTETIGIEEKHEN